MKAQPNPQRLAEQQEFEKLLGPEAKRRFEADRLQRSGQRLEARLAQLSAMAATSTSRIQQKQRGRRFAIRILVPAMLLAAAVAGGAYLVVHSIVSTSDDQPQPPAPPKTPKPSRTDFPNQPMPQPEQPAVAPQEDLVPPAKRHFPKLAQAPKEPAVEPMASALPNSQLPEQLALLHQAKANALEGRLLEALALIGELLQKYPQSPLLPEALYNQVEWFYLSGQYPQAITSATSLLSQPQFAGKKAQLYRILGDSYLHLERCEEAQDAFRQALGLGLTGEQAQAARRGIKKCNGPQPSTDGTP